MTGYADTEDPVALLNRAPDTSGGPTVEEAIREAGFEVQVVNWIWEQVVGTNLVESIITPITGDFEKIAQQAGQWENVCDALQAIRNNLNAGLGELQPGWQGSAADEFRNLIGTKWTLGIEADAQAAKLIGFALKKVAEGSRRACDQALELIKKLVDKLIEAAATAPIPVVGWGRAVKLVYDGIQIYNAIMQLIEGIRAVIEGAQQVIQGVQQVGTALSKLDDISNLNDALNVANETGEGVANVAGGVSSVRDGLQQTTSAAADVADSASSARDNAHGLADERAAARDQSTSPSGDATTTTGNGDRAGTREPGGDGNSMRDNEGDAGADGRQRECAPGSGDPVDLTTGQMFLGQVDLDLPGVLPLTLERTHFSEYRVGRWFGRSWASTLDQRIEVEEDAVYFADPSGARLKYPRPQAGGGPVLPQAGPRWPLTMTPDGGYLVSKADTGHTLSFPSGTGAVRAITDRNGNRIDVDYDDSGALRELRHSGGYRVGVDTVDGLVTRIWLHGQDDEAITVTRYRYDDHRRLVAVLNSSNIPMTFDYDHDGRIVRWQDRNGEWYRYSYDERGRVVRTEGSGQALTGTWWYDTENRTTVYTDAVGRPTTYHYNEAYQIVREVDASGAETIQEWAGYDRLAARTDPLGHTTRYAYDDAGNRTTVTHPDGTRELAEYNEFGLPTAVTTTDGAVWRYGYDERGNRTETVDPAGATTRYTYGERGQKLSATDPEGNVRRMETDAAGLAIASTDPLGAVTRCTRDPFGRPVTITDAAGGVTRLAWTVEGRLRARTGPDGGTEQWHHDGEGNDIAYVDAVGNVTRTTTTHFDLPLVRLEPGGARTEFTYDAELRLVAVTNPQGLVWRYEYDVAGNVVYERGFNGREQRYDYDAAGRLVRRTNGAGQVTEYLRDARGNVVERHDADGVARFEFDAAGRMVRAVNDDADVRFVRDVFGRVVTESVNGRTVTSAYDRLGRRTHRRTPTGAESAWSYDARHQPTALHTAGHTVTFAYDSAGRETRRLLDTGAALAQEWEPSGRLAGQIVSGGAGRPVQRRHYRYRQDGQLSAVEDQLTGNRMVDVDAAGRVMGVRGPSWAEYYAYDPAGNVTDAGTPNPDARGPRQYAGTTLRHAGNVSYRHDAQGRVVLRQRKRLSAKPETWRYDWNAEDRLVGVVTPDGTTWRYRYDALGRRIAKERLTADGTVAARVDFVWDGLTLAEQVDSAGRAFSWNFQPGTFRPATQAERVPAGDASQEWVDREFYAIVTDLVGTPTELVDLAGNLAWHAATTVWGDLLANRAARTSTPFRFPGQYHDPESGLHYNLHRYYDPLSGRYCSDDPLGLAGGPNPSAYVDNPLRAIDPLGLTPSCTDPPRPPDSPAYSVAYESELGPDDYPGRSDRHHFSVANQQLHAAFQNDPAFAQAMDDMYPGIVDGVQPGPRGAYPRMSPHEDLTWHHEANRPGVLQLIPREHHTAPGPVQGSLHPEGRGGMENWGGGRRR
jgi:RHS repeat-associated protein